MQGFQNLSTEISLDAASPMFDGVPQRVNQQLASRGFVASSSPPLVRNHQTGQDMPYNGQIPHDLTQLTDEHLGWYIGMVSGWLEYVSDQLSEAYGNMLTSEKKLEFINAHLYIIHKKDGEKKRTEPERKAMVLVDRRYVEAQTEALYHETYYRHVKAIAAAAEQNFSAISRRITQRQQDIERQKRTVGIGNAGGPLFRQP